MVAFVWCCAMLRFGPIWRKQEFYCQRIRELTRSTFKLIVILMDKTIVKLLRLLFVWYSTFCRFLFWCCFRFVDCVSQPVNQSAHCSMPKVIPMLCQNRTNMVKSNETYKSERKIELNFNSCPSDIHTFGNTYKHTQTYGYRMIFNFNFYRKVNKKVNSIRTMSSIS